MDTLRIVVVVLGFMIILATGFLGYFILNRPERLKETAQTLAIMKPVTEKIDLSKPLHIQSITTGSQSFLIVLSSPEGDQEFFVIDQMSGRLLSRFQLLSPRLSQSKR